MKGVETIAVMQPYFFPYAGYFRLFARADHFVILDTVQFPRRGRVHRTQVPGPSQTDKIEWLTLPLQRAPRETTIREIRFSEQARAHFDQRLRRLDWLESARGTGTDRIRELLDWPLTGYLVDYLETCIQSILDLLGIRTSITRSSELDIDSTLSGAERIIAIAKCFGARRYVNLPGGRGLYSTRRFARSGLWLEFLPDYSGPNRYLLHALLTREPESIAADILDR